jgi:hypothetical protein
LNDDLTEFPGWIEADDARKQRILAAAKRYLAEWQSHPDEWIETRKIHFPDFAGYRALVLVVRFDLTILESLSAEQWSNVAPSILGFPTSSGIRNDGEERQMRLIAAAYQQAPDTVIETLVKLIDRENADDQSKHLYVLRRVEQCWDDKLISALFEKARDGSLKPSCLGVLLTELVGRGSADAVAYAKSLISPRTDDVRRDAARHAAVVIWLNVDGRGWDVLWPEFLADRLFFRDVMADVAHERRQFRRPPVELSEEQLADLYTLLSQEFPQNEDPDQDGAHFVGPRESVQFYRDNILSTLRDRGTTAACAAVERIKETLPHLDFLSWTLRAARRVTLQATWMPLSIEQVRELTHRPATRLVRNGRELQEVILESLDRLQQRLHGETPTVRDLWDHNRKVDQWEPVDENAFSDYITRHLRDDLSGCGIVALREVEIRRGNGKKGERTDIYVTAMMVGPQPGTFKTERVILEVKGCWHSELKTAMESQLKNQYLKDNNCEHGIYVVGWFVCDSWNASDSRRGKTPKWTIDEAREYFKKQKVKLSDEGDLLEFRIVDASLA